MTEFHSQALHPHVLTISPVSSSDTIILGIKLQHLDLRGHSQSSPNLSERNIKDYVEFIHTTSVHSVHQLLYKYSGRYCGFSSIPAVMEEFLEEICIFIIFFFKKSLFIKKKKKKKDNTNTDEK